MARYDYRCLECNSLTEHDFKIGTAPAKTLCAQCGSEAERAISAHKSYSIKGDNSASITPKRFREAAPATS